MKCHIPQISWHNRDPVLSIDSQKTENISLRRIATAGTDTHVFIWMLHLQNKGTIEVEFVADLTRHTRAVNAVRFSPSGEILASADDEACIILWKQHNRDESDIFDDNDDGNKEHWVPLKILRGHIDDVCDICWSKDSSALISGSVDNTAIMWDVQKGKNMGILGDQKGFVQGVAWDPVGQYLATLSSDRTLRIYSQQNKRTLYKVQKAAIPGVKETSEGVPKSSRIFYDDTLKTFCRRLAFSPDGEILVVPSGIIEQDDGKFTNASFVFSRHALNRPVMCLPTDDKFTVAVRCCPVLFALRHDGKISSDSETDKKENVDPIFNLPYRIVFAVATQNAMLVYDSQHMLPIAHIGNIHYTRLTDIAWSSDAKILMASSTDGYCSFVIFEDGELGIPYKEETSQKSGKDTECINVAKTVPVPIEENKLSNKPVQIIPKDSTTDNKPTRNEEPVKNSNSICPDTSVASGSEPIECKESVKSPKTFSNTSAAAASDQEAMDWNGTVPDASSEKSVKTEDGNSMGNANECNNSLTTESTHTTGTTKASNPLTNKKVAKVARRVQLITIAGREEK